MQTRIIALANLKGGSGKTTSTAFLAHAFAQRGRKPVIVDADPQGSITRWQGLASWEIPAMGLASPMLHRQLPKLIDLNRFDMVLIDTPPLAEQMGIVDSAMRASTDIIVPLAPTTMEVDRSAPVIAAINDARDRMSMAPRVWFLLNRTVHNALSTREVRDLISNANQKVLDQAIPRLELYGRAFGEPIRAAEETHYGSVADQLLTYWEATQ